MGVLNTNLTTIITILLCRNIVITQSFIIQNLSSDNGTTKNKCTYPDEFPLFSDDTCISREAYTAIFLISIILAGISFLSLAALLFCLCRRYWQLSKEDDDDSNGESNTAGRYPPNPEILSAVTTVSDNNRSPLSGQTGVQTYQSISQTYSPAPYVVDDPVPANAANKKPLRNKPRSDSIPLDTYDRPKPTSTKPKPKPTKTTDLDDYHDEPSSRVDSTAF